MDRDKLAIAIFRKQNPRVGMSDNDIIQQFRNDERDLKNLGPGVVSLTLTAMNVADAALSFFRTYLESDEVVERMAKAHCDYFGGEGWWELGLLADTLPEGRKAMRAALNAAGGKQDGR